MIIFVYKILLVYPAHHTIIIRKHFLKVTKPEKNNKKPEIRKWQENKTNKGDIEEEENSFTDDVKVHWPGKWLVFL